MGKGYIFAGLLGVVLLVSILAFNILPKNDSDVFGVINYHSFVCKEVIRANPDGSVCTENCKIEKECGPNQLFTSGRNFIQSCLGAGTCTALTNITLCNATSTAASGLCGEPAAAGTEAFTYFNDTTLLGPNNTATLIASNNTGAFFISKTFTSDNNNMTTNVTRIGNGSHFFAGNSFTVVTLQANDQLNVTWTIWAA